MLCRPWLEPDDPALDCTADAYPDGILTRAIEAASDVLYVMGGRRHPGLCVDVVRPCGPQGGYRWHRPVSRQVADTAAVVVDGGMIMGGWGWWGHPGCGCGGPCGCAQVVCLPGRPVRRVITVTVGGEQVTGGWRIVDRHCLARTDGGAWPTWNNVALAGSGASGVADVGVFEVEYEWGEAPPQLGVLGAAALACEFAQAFTGKASCLPRRVTQVTSEGVTVVVADPFKFFTEGRTGVAHADLYLAAYNPKGQRFRPGMIAPPRSSYHRVR